jgi:hypothetical protein
MISKAFFQNERRLLVLNFTRVRTTEFIAYTNSSFKKGDKLKVVELSFAKPGGSEPFQVFWQPAQGVIAEGIRRREHSKCLTS